MGADPVDAGQVEAVMRAASVLLAVVAQSVAEVEDVVTTPQLRVLVLIATHGPQHLGAVAADLGVHPSNATRICERLVNAGLIERADDPQDRRFLKLVLSARGRQLVEQVMDHRRTAIAAVVGRLPTRARASLAAALDAFARSAGEDGTEDGRFALRAGD
ncbi:MarR family winged helix-turn-helix transcriptional regulator [Paenarthrobacter sp. PH39-S1]|uniref:MarR family winged helix-turn-helix transcriptional regulator n=1 Tax=Micrococcaceae TaxID=1268 RepID=UPI0024B93ACB|nr:MarR family transcriptional regulator [Paenarthrobacter sp. PH39-S1]MDJ0354984.1 MarR family transcriptional regulator [Paenarthrobacter sp. PH39-S1]